MSTISLAEWDRLMDAGATTCAVGIPPGRCAVYRDRAEAEAAADEMAHGLFVQWDGHRGRQVVTAEAVRELEAGI